MEVGRRITSDRRPIYVSWRRDIKGSLLGCTRGEAIGKGKSQVGKMDAILTDPHLDMIKRCILMHVIVPKVEYAGEVWEGNAKFVKQLETVHMTAS